MNWIWHSTTGLEPIRANVSDSEHNQTHATAQLRSSNALWALRGLQLMSNVVLDVFFLIVSVTLRPKADISRTAAASKMATAGSDVHFLRRGW